MRALRDGAVCRAKGYAVSDKTPDDIFKLAKDERIEYVDVRFCDLPGTMQHFTIPMYVFDQSVFDRWRGDDLEREVLPGLSAAGELFAYRHRGFWKSMDTYKDALELTALCRDGTAPWLHSATRDSFAKSSITVGVITSAVAPEIQRGEGLASPEFEAIRSSKANRKKTCTLAPLR